MKELFLSLDNAVMVIVDRMNLVDEEMREVVRNELMQKCYLSDDQFSIGFETARRQAIEVLKQIYCSGNSNE